MTGLFGWLLVWILVKSLFYPYKPIQIGGFRWEGALYPMIRTFPIETMIPSSSDGGLADAMPFIDEKLDEFFKNKLKEKLPIISMFIGEKTITQLKGVFMDELQDLFPELIKHFTATATEGVSTKLMSTIPTLEPIIMNATKIVRWAAFFIGAIWGILTYFLAHLF